MISTETSKSLEQALNFNSENIFEYINSMLSDVNAEIIGSQANETLQKLCEYIRSLPISDSDSAVFEVEDMATEALAQTSHYAYKAGFIEACRL